MKPIFKYALLLLVGLAMTGIFIRCSDDDSNGGTPSITYIRLTDPASSDSLITSAGQGQMIAIIGQNLQNARELWVNDQQATLSPTFITRTSIITKVPSLIPATINNHMKIIFADGDSLIHDFKLAINEPVIGYMKSEYVNAGDVATINGDFFYEPLTVKFTGGVEGELVSVEDRIIEVRVPDGAEPGPVTIINNFGETESAFWFRDNRNIIASFDETTAGLWHGADLIVATDEAIPAIEGKFIRMNKALAAWDWFELYVGPANSDVSIDLKNIPAEATENPAKYNLKFELNTLKSLTGATIHIYIGNGDLIAGRDAYTFSWQPNINTDGKWETISIPWEEVYKANNEFPYNADGYNISVHFSGPSAVDADFGLDNMRVVPNITE
jgi:hypothetical protein